MNPKQQKPNIKMLAKKLQLMEDIRCNLFSMRVDVVEEARINFLTCSLHYN
jgi:hypothetical protein